MLAIIKELPAHVLGVRATGAVDAGDIKNVLVPALEKQDDEFGYINYLLVLDTAVQNFSAGAWFQDMKAGLVNFTKWNRIAVVTSQEAVGKFTDIFTLTIPGKSRGFKPEQLEEAITWVSEKD